MKALFNQSYDLTKIVSNIYSLIENKQYHQAKKILLTLHYADIADILDQIFTDDDMIEFLSVVISDLPADTFHCLNHYSLIKIFSLLDKQQFAQVVEQIDVSDAVNMIGNLSNKDREEVLSYCSDTKSKEIAKGLSYIYDTVGRIMEHDLIALMNTWTISQSINYIKKNIGYLKNHSNHLIVVNSKSKPIKYINMYVIMTSNPDQIVDDLSYQDLKIVNTNTQLDEISYLFKQYELQIIAVVNKLGKLVGIVPVSNIVNIIAEQNNEYILQLGGVKNIDDTFAGTLHTVRHRFPWLGLNLMLSFLTAIVVSYFTVTIQEKAALVAIIPVVASLSSNAATQVMTVTVRSIETTQYTINNFTKRIINKEVLVSIINSIGLTSIGILAIYVFSSDKKLTLIFGFSVMFNFVFFSILGCIIPLTLNKLKIDPAVPSNTILNNLPDFISYSSFLLIASYIFK